MRPTGLEGVIEICRQSSHLREGDDEPVSFPLDLLVEKWLIYCCPIFAAPAFIPQKSGETPAGPPRSGGILRRSSPIRGVAGGGGGSVGASAWKSDL
ncbi:MAG: hypothetical protein KA967_05945 [Methanoculleus sp.]|nr:hypothetical protein [Methanoculleus sp.]